MLQIAYTSVAADAFGPGDIFKIVESSNRNNANVGVTGFLMFKEGQFLQILEGDPEALNTLMRVIEKDERHHSIETFSREEISERLFPQWGMKRFVPPTTLADLADFHDILDQAPPKVAEAIEGFLAVPA